jgi:hypothetical protein
MVGSCKAGWGTLWLGVARHDRVRQGLVGWGEFSLGEVRFGAPWSVLVWQAAAG